MPEERSPLTPTATGEVLKLLGGWMLPKERLEALSPQLAGILAQVHEVRRAPVHEVEPLTIFRVGR